jgi:hypothetical protein
MPDQSHLAPSITRHETDLRSGRRIRSDTVDRWKPEIPRRGDNGLPTGCGCGPRRRCAPYRGGVAGLQGGDPNSRRHSEQAPAGKAWRSVCGFLLQTGQPDKDATRTALPITTPSKSRSSARSVQPCAVLGSLPRRFTIVRPTLVTSSPLRTVGKCIVARNPGGPASRSKEAW